MKNDLSTDKILKRMSSLLTDCRETNPYAPRDCSNLEISSNFISTSGELYFIYYHRYKLQNEVTKVKTHEGWETLLEGLEKDAEKLIQVTGLETLGLKWLVFTDTDITQIIGILQRITSTNET